MKTKDEKDFLSLPDWKKVELKVSYSKFVNYRLMTDDQEFDRKQKIYKIASHFGKVDLEYLITNQSMSLDNSWPKSLESFVTPKLLDIFSTDWFCKFGYCFFCDFFRGANKIHYKYFFARKSKNKIIPFSGICDHILMHKYESPISNQNFVDPEFCCHLWTPLDLYQQIIQSEISSALSQSKEYSIEDYAYDLHNVNIWNYFFNKYGHLDF